MFAHLHEIRLQYMMKKNQERIGGEDDKEIQDQAHGRRAEHHHKWIIELEEPAYQRGKIYD